jgi:hypothetical protein
MQRTTFFDKTNWFYNQAWYMNSADEAIYLSIFPEDYKEYTYKVSYLPFIYENKRVYVSTESCFSYD